MGSFAQPVLKAEIAMLFGIPNISNKIVPALIFKLQ